MSLLDVQNLCVSIEGKQVLKNLSININPGGTHPGQHRIGQMGVGGEARAVCD